MERRDKPLLIGWNKSPYVRRVAISLNLLGIDYEQHWANAWDAYEDIRALNPIAKIPALVTPDGEVLTESWAILDWLDLLVGPERALMPPMPLRSKVRRLTALAGAVADKSRELRYERDLRPPRLRYAEWIARWSGQITSGLAALDDMIEEPYAAGERLTQADVTIFVAIESVRHNHQDLMRPGRFPRLHELHRQNSRLEAFAKAPREAPVDDRGIA